MVVAIKITPCGWNDEPADVGAILNHANTDARPNGIPSKSIRIGRNRGSDVHANSPSCTIVVAIAIVSGSVTNIDRIHAGLVRTVPIEENPYPAVRASLGGRQFGGRRVVDHRGVRPAAQADADDLTEFAPSPGASGIGKAFEDDINITEIARAADSAFGSGNNGTIARRDDRRNAIRVIAVGVSSKQGYVGVDWYGSKRRDSEWRYAENSAYEAKQPEEDGDHFHVRLYSAGERKSMQGQTRQWIVTVHIWSQKRVDSGVTAISHRSRGQMMPSS